MSSVAQLSLATDTTVGPSGFCSLVGTSSPREVRPVLAEVTAEISVGSILGEVLSEPKVSPCDDAMGVEMSDCGGPVAGLLETPNAVLGSSWFPYAGSTLGPSWFPRAGSTSVAMYSKIELLQRP